MIFINRLLTVVISESNRTRTAVISAGRALRSGIEQEVRDPAGVGLEEKRK
jgi:hypothetical protein